MLTEECDTRRFLEERGIRVSETDLGERIQQLDDQPPCGGTRWLRFQEKRGKEHEVPVHSKAKEAVNLWLKQSLLASNPSAPLFPSFGKNRETIESRRLDRRSVLKLVAKRAKASGILKRVCCHSFRATGVTEYMNSGGTIEIAQRIAGHTSPATTRIYDRSGDVLTLEEIERVQIGKKRQI